MTTVADLQGGPRGSDEVRARLSTGPAAAASGPAAGRAFGAILDAPAAEGAVSPGAAMPEAGQAENSPASARQSDSPAPGATGAADARAKTGKSDADHASRLATGPADEAPRMPRSALSHGGAGTGSIAPEEAAATGPTGAVQGGPLDLSDTADPAVAPRPDTVTEDADTPIAQPAAADRDPEGQPGAPETETAPVAAVQRASPEGQGVTDTGADVPVAPAMTPPAAAPVVAAPETGVRLAPESQPASGGASAALDGTVPPGTKSAPLAAAPRLLMSGLPGEERTDTAPAPDIRAPRCRCHIPVVRCARVRVCSPRPRIPERCLHGACRGDEDDFRGRSPR